MGGSLISDIYIKTNSLVVVAEIGFSPSGNEAGSGRAGAPNPMLPTCCNQVKRPSKSVIPSEGRVPACRDEDESKDPEDVSFFIAALGVLSMLLRANSLMRHIRFTHYRDHSTPRPAAHVEMKFCRRCAQDDRVRGHFIWTQ